MNIEPLISIVIPIYNVEEYLRECIDSVLGQTYKRIEVILVDDGSSDGSARICDEYAQMDNRVMAIHRENEGVSSARNYGTQIAVGEYITYVDSDDYWRGANNLVNIVKLINKTDADIVSFNATLLYENGTEIRAESIGSEAINGKSKVEVLSYLIENAKFEVSAWSKVIKATIIKSNNIEFEKGLLSAEDIDWNFHIYLNANCIVVYETPFYLYRQGRAGSTTSTISSRSCKDLLYVIKKWRVFFLNCSLERGEKELYLGYLAYQFGILMGLIANIDPKTRAKISGEMMECSSLLKCTNNYKTRRVTTLHKLLGFRLTSRILGCYIRLKSKGYKY